jgi:ssDNA-binding Zn-finger/Zn-ribbon topoisomerase 1
MIPTVDTSEYRPCPHCGLTQIRIFSSEHRWVHVGTQSPTCAVKP